MRFWVYLWGIETFHLKKTMPESHQCFESTYEELKHTLSPSFRSLSLMCFESTYEELKLWKYFWTYICNLTFWVYLWGIETLSDMTRMYCDIRFWVYLWGIETEAVTSLPCILAGFWVYLWGIETCYFVTPISIEYWVLSLPMRNWNESKQHLSIYQWLCFESTYEELKLLITSGITSSPTSFESTYEELKLQPPSMILFPQPRFESTYEELKPGHGILR